MLTTRYFALPNPDYLFKKPLSPPDTTFASETYPLSLVDVRCDAHIENALTKMLRSNRNSRGYPLTLAYVTCYSLFPNRLSQNLHEYRIERVNPLTKKSKAHNQQDVFPKESDH